jgi:FixJ family two-component response regulator
VLDGVRAGRTNQEIATDLGVTFHTVKYHIATSMTLTFGGARRLADRSQPHDEAPLESGDWTITVPLD